MTGQTVRVMVKRQRGKQSKIFLSQASSVFARHQNPREPKNKASLNSTAGHHSHECEYATAKAKNVESATW